MRIPHAAYLGTNQRIAPSLDVPLEPFLALYLIDQHFLDVELL